MAEQSTPKPQPRWSIEVRRAAAQAAVTASKITGRPVDPRGKKLAESDEQTDPAS
jgi:hypothetical protein